MGATNPLQNLAYDLADTHGSCNWLAWRGLLVRGRKGDKHALFILEHGAPDFADRIAAFLAGGEEKKWSQLSLLSHVSKRESEPGLLGRSEFHAAQGGSAAMAGELR